MDPPLGVWDRARTPHASVAVATVVAIVIVRWSRPELHEDVGPCLEALHGVWRVRRQRVRVAWPDAASLVAELHLEFASDDVAGLLDGVGMAASGGALLEEELIDPQQRAPRELTLLHSRQDCLEWAARQREQRSLDAHLLSLAVDLTASPISWTRSGPVNGSRCSLVLRDLRGAHQIRPLLDAPDAVSGPGWDVEAVARAELEVLSAKALREAARDAVHAF